MADLTSIKTQTQSVALNRKADGKYTSYINLCGIVTKALIFTTFSGKGGTKGSCKSEF